MSIIFDETTRLGEVLVIIVHYIQQWLILLQFLAKSITGKEVAHQLSSKFSVTYGIESHLILATMRDGAGVNNVAIGVVKIM